MKSQPNQNTLRVEIGSTLDTQVIALENVFDIRRVCDWLRECTQESSECLINMFIRRQKGERYTVF